MNYKQLSKLVAYFSRHDRENELKMDREGWIRVEDLIDCLNKRVKNFDRELLEKVINYSNKKRFELKDDFIRALYGHSKDKEVMINSQCPPDFLYHGTGRSNLSDIESFGLKGLSRRYVHLSVDRENAIDAGRRKDKNPVLFRVFSYEAFVSGIRFQKGNDEIRIAEDIPSVFLEKI